MKGFKHLLLLMVIAFPILCTPITALAANESSSTSSSSANNPSQVASNDSVQKIKQKGTLVVGMSADYPPYEFTTKENGKNKYELDKDPTIFVSGDGGPWIKGFDEAFPNAICLRSFPLF